ncbi:MAG: FHA domain-containing protein [Anaerolineae bacterium]
MEEPQWAGEPAGNGKNTVSCPPEPRALAIRLKIGESREVELPLDKDIHIGRADPTEDVFPEIVLIDDSISRRHARILKRDGAIALEDLCSVNGTFLNGERLNPYLPKTLRDGDTVQLGTLLIGVKFQAE